MVNAKTTLECASKQVENASKQVENRVKTGQKRVKTGGIIGLDCACVARRGQKCFTSVNITLHNNKSG